MPAEGSLLELGVIVGFESILCCAQLGESCGELGAGVTELAKDIGVLELGLLGLCEQASAVLRALKGVRGEVVDGTSVALHGVV